MREERKKLFWLLSRINLTEEQAQVIFNVEKRKEYGIDLSDTAIIENPYNLYEKTRECQSAFRIPVNKIDMAVFPAKIIAEQNPVPEPSFIESGDDQRRIRALAVNILEEQTKNGHTVYPQFKLVEELTNFPSDPKYEVSSDIIDSIQAFLSDELVLIKCEDDSHAFQLKRLNEIDHCIQSFVNERLNTDRFEIKEDWQKIVDEYFGSLCTDDNELAARREKIAILNEFADSPFSVLIGGAGTGKTTLLALLCKSEKIKNGGVLLLAPTGKARVRISKTMNSMGVKHDALTIAQFLLKKQEI